MNPFDSKAADWEENPQRAELSRKIAGAIQAGVPLSTQMFAMEFGCGTGLISRELLPLIACPEQGRRGKITAIDLSSGMIAQLKKRIEEGNLQQITARCLDILKEKPTEKVDLIFTAMALHHIQDTASILDALLAQLNPGGWIAIADLDQEDGTFHEEEEGFIHHGIDREKLIIDLLDRGCEAASSVTVHEIQKNNRTYPVFLITARKKI